MAAIQILVRVIQSFYTGLPGRIAQGDRFIFSDDLVLERYNNRTPGNRPNDLPQDETQRLAGTQSGIAIFVRVVVANDRFFPANSRLVEFESTYKFNAVPNTPLQMGQVTTQGVVLIGSNFEHLEPPIRVAIVGGTGPYSRARGTVTEGIQGTPTEPERLLDIEV